MTLIQGVVAFFSSLTGSWLAFPVTVSAVVSTVVATWSVLDIWITRQVWRQRNGVVSQPSSTARPPIRAGREEGPAETASLSEAA
ncbi:hypothetical protein [Streptomyces sp. NBC_00572]|uniref:hypothetical protein n=1 Tax=Streptomyces sp. NBC_00572 TaxID=2903664 RepID=UPI002250EC22|nr:hypothetical protein [Streptomyces sp. NBC_00572]MCX4979603.1 hypothetical protein [Streptomyces sp. NBC_00572]